MIVRKRRGRRDCVVWRALWPACFIITNAYVRQQEYIAEVALGMYDGTLYPGQRSPTELQRHTGRTCIQFTQYGGSVLSPGG